MKEIETFTPVDMDMASQLERSAAMYAESVTIDFSEGQIWRPYTTTEGSLDHYPVTPKVVMLMKHVRDERYGTIPRNVASDLVEKYLRPGESIRERNRMPL